MKLKVLILTLEQLFNMCVIKKLTVIFLAIFFLESKLFAQTPHFLDFQQILNESIAGKKAQNELKKRLEQTVKKLNENQKKLQEEEKKTIQQKKVISAEEYKKKIDSLRKKVANLQKNRSDALQKIATQRAKAKQELLNNLNPIIQEYMQKNQIRMVLNKKNLILADENLNITNDVMKLLNDKIKSVKLD